MKSFELGEVVLLPFLYSDLKSSKRRPAVVLLDSGDDDVLVAKITTQEYRSPYDLPLMAWSVAGLRSPSFVRLHKLFAAEKDHVIERIGSVHPTDLVRVQRIFRSMI